MQTSCEFRPRKILVPTDFSASSEIALKTAADLARFVHAKVYLLHIVPMLLNVPYPGYSNFSFPEQEFLNEARDSATRKLETLVELLRSEEVDSDFGIETGNDVVGNIMMVIEREHADMLVLSTHGVSGWRPMIFGSIAEKVIKLVECPLLLLRSPKEQRNADTRPEHTAL